MHKTGLFTALPKKLTPPENKEVVLDTLTDIASDIVKTKEKTNALQVSSEHSNPQPMHINSQDIQKELNTNDGRTQVLTTENNSQTATIKQINPRLAEENSDIFNTGIRALVSKDLNETNTEKFSQLVKTANNEYNTSLVSPSIDAPQFTEDYLFLKETNVIEIECDNSIRANLKLLASLTGGNIKCTNKNFQQFIDNRLGQKSQTDQ